MKSLNEISRLNAEDLERIGADESIPVPEDLSSKVYGTIARKHNWTRTGGIAVAAAAILVAGLFFTREPEPKDTFDDPYLAYAALEEALNTVGGKMQKSIEIVEEQSAPINKIEYWK